MGINVKRFMIPLQSRQELRNSFRFRLFQLNIFHDPEGVVLQMEDESAPAGQGFFLLIELEGIVSWDGAEDDAAMPTNGITDGSHTRAARPFLTVELAFATPNFATGPGLVRTLTLVC